MTEYSNENEKQEIKEEQIQAEVRGSNINARKKPNKRRGLGIFIAIIMIIILALAVIFFVAFQSSSKFEKVKDECVQIAGQLSSGDNYFTLDTDPDENMDEVLKAIIHRDTLERTLEAIKYANKELGFPGSLYNDMVRTSAMMGRLSEENDKYKVSWTYHPDHGLEVTYTKKKRF